MFGAASAVTLPAAGRWRIPLAWLLVKLALVARLLVYHLLCGRIRKQLAAGTCRWTSPQLRQWNELATLLLVAIVMLAVFKTLFNAVWGTLALIGFGVAAGGGGQLMRRRADRGGSARSSRARPRSAPALRAGVLGAEACSAGVPAAGAAEGAFGGDQLVGAGGR